MVSYNIQYICMNNSEFIYSHSNSFKLKNNKTVIDIKMNELVKISDKNSDDVSISGKEIIIISIEKR